MVNPLLVGAAQSVAQGASNALFAELIGSLKDLKRVVERSVEMSENYQKQTLSFGAGITEINEQLSPSLKKLRGTLDQKLDIGIRSLIEGLDANILGVNRLVNSQQVTGQQWQKTIVTFAKLESQGGLTIDALESLGSITHDASIRYRVQSQKLIQVLDALDKNFVSLNIGGLGEHVYEAVTILASQLGPQYTQNLTKTLNFIFDEGFDSFQRLTALGIGSVRERLAAARSTEEALLIMKDSLATASQSFADVVSDARSFYSNIAVGTDTFGEAAKDIWALNQRLIRGIRDVQNDQRDYAQSLSVIYAEIINPLKKLVIENYDNLYTIGSAIGQVAEAFSNVIFGWFSNLTKDKENVATAIQGFIFDMALIFSKVLDTVVDTYNVLKGMGEDIKKIANVFAPTPGGNAGSQAPGWPGSVMPWNWAWGNNPNTYPEPITEESKVLNPSYVISFTKMMENLIANAPVLNQIADNTRKTAENTGRQSAPGFLSFSDQSLSMSMRSILGFNADKGLKLLQDLVDVTKEVNNKNDLTLGKVLDNGNM